MPVITDKDGRKWVELDIEVGDLDEYFEKDQSDESDNGLGILRWGAGRLGNMQVDVEENVCFGLITDEV